MLFKNIVESKGWKVTTVFMIEPHEWQIKITYNVNFEPEAWRQIYGLIELYNLQHHYSLKSEISAPLWQKGTVRKEHMKVFIMRSIRVQIQHRILRQCLLYHIQLHRVQADDEVCTCPLPRLCDAKIHPLPNNLKGVW